MDNPQREDHIAKLQDMNPDVRGSAANALGEIGNASSIPSLIEALKDKSDFVRLAAATELWKIGAPAFPAVGRAVRDHYSHAPNVTWETIRETGSVSALPVLLAALKDTNFEVRWFAVQMLEKLGDPSAVPALTEVLQDENVSACCFAATALGKIGGVSAIPGLLEVFKDCRRDARFIHIEAAKALGEIGDVTAVPGIVEVLLDRRPRRPARFRHMNVALALEQIGDSVALPRKILANSLWSAQERIDLLDKLRRVRCRRKEWGAEAVTVHYRFPETLTLCQTVLNEADVEASAGAQSVLNWLHGDRNLLHASQADTIIRSQELVRPVEGGETETKPETLLHAANDPVLDEKMPFCRLTIWERLSGRRKDVIS